MTRLWDLLPDEVARRIRGERKFNSKEEAGVGVGEDQSQAREQESVAMPVPGKLGYLHLRQHQRRATYVGRANRVIQL